MNEKPTETGPGTERPAGAPKNRTVEGVVRGQPPRKRSRVDDEIAAALPRLPHASGAPVTCYAYALSLPDVDMVRSSALCLRLVTRPCLSPLIRSDPQQGRDYEHFAGLRFAGFHLISSTSLHIPQFKLCGTSRRQTSHTHTQHNTVRHGTTRHNRQGPDSWWCTWW